MTNILFLADLHLAAKGPTPQHLALEALSQLIQHCLLYTSPDTPLRDTPGRATKSGCA